MPGGTRLFAISTAVLVAVSLVRSTPSHASTQVVFSYTGSNQTWTVPAGVTSVTINMLGAGGGGGQVGAGSVAFGGGGGAVSGTLTVVPGDTLTLIVGQGGINDNVSQPLNRNYRFGGGASGAGNSGFWPNTWGSGGGRSAVRSSNGLYGTAGDVLTAGAGGGGGWDTALGAGGAGGGTNGSNGGRGATTDGGGGGTQSAGGAGGGPSEPGVAGIQYAGGYAVLSGYPASEAGGGGGGYYGGGGGGNNGGGGGGSSYIGVAAYFTGTTTGGSGRTPGTTSWPSACGTNPGRGADPGNSSTVGLGGHGCIVITYSASGGGTTIEDPPPPPAPWLQAYGRATASAPCAEGWVPSWALWPNNGSGGFTCERRLEYLREEWMYVPGHFGQWEQATEIVS